MIKTECARYHAHPNGVVPAKGSDERFPAMSPGYVPVQPVGACVL